MSFNAYRMPLWDIQLGYSCESITGMYKKFIDGMSFEYVANAPGLAQVSVRSHAYAEELFVEGMPVKIFLGWNQNSMAKMIDGVIVTRPDGVAATEVSYTITIQDKNSVRLSRIKKSQVIPSRYKQGIIGFVCASAKIPAVISIADNTIIEEEFIPVQKNETDAEFLFRCAKRWNCVVWFDSNAVYFMDADSAYTYGDQNRIKTFEDSLHAYELGYRMNSTKNNVAKVSWKKHDTKGGTSGNPGTEGANEEGPVKTADDFEFDHWGVKWSLKPALAQEFNKAGIGKKIQLIKKYSIIANEAGNAQAQSTIKKYFVPVVHGKKSFKGGPGGSSPKHGKKAGLELSIDLNIGDPFLRPPRNAVLMSGVVGQENSYLPSFLFKDSTDKQKLVIDKVKTALQNGMISTNLVATI